MYSPNGEKIAFLAGRDEIQVLDRKTGDTNVAFGKEHNYSYSDGDIAFDWSADSKWIIADYAARGRLFVPNIGIVPADGSAQPVDISHSGYTDTIFGTVPVTVNEIMEVGGVNSISWPRF